MRVLIACEFSGVVRRAFRARGHDAWSCDLLPAEDGAPSSNGRGWHFQMDVRRILDARWNLLIAHPPCTHLAVSGARHFAAKQASGVQEEALQFVRDLLDAPIPMIALENPISIISSRIRKPDQIIQPWQFGHGETKATCFWLNNLPPLVPTNIVEGREARVHRMPPGPDRLEGAQPHLRRHRGGNGRPVGLSERRKDCSMTDAPAFTPGPWRVDYAARSGGNIIAPSGAVASTRWFGTTHKQVMEDYRNADLIAAAPELYEALALVAPNKWGVSAQTRAKIEAALAKARGQVTCAMGHSPNGQDPQGLGAKPEWPGLANGEMRPILSMTQRNLTMTDIRIRKIDIDDLRSNEPPSWGKVSTVINGVEVQLTLSQPRIDRLLEAITPIVMETIEEITRPGVKWSVVKGLSA